MKRLLTILLLAAGTAYGQINNPPTSVNIVDSTATGRAVLTATNAAAAATAIGLGATNAVSFRSVTLSGPLAFGDDNAVGSSGSLRTAITNAQQIEFVTTGTVRATLGPTNFTLAQNGGALAFGAGNTTGAATTRTNLGGTTVGNAVFTATNAAAAATAIGLGTTNSPIFSNIQLGVFGSGSSGGFAGRTGGGLLELYGTNLTTAEPAFYGFSGFANVAFSPGTARTNLGLGAANAVTFSNITATGTLTATGNATLNGSGNLAPQQTADSASSLMTRELTDSNPLEAFSKVRPLLAYGSSTGTGSTANLNTYALGSADLRSGTNVSGYARAVLYRGVNNPSHLTGSGIQLSQNLAVSFVTIVRDEIRTNAAIRFIVGGAGTGSPAPANSNALTGRGFGIEIARTSTTNMWPAASIRARLFAHDGTNYFTSDYTTDFAALNNNQFILNYTTNGTVSLRFSTAGNAPARPSTTPVLTLTNGPVGSFTVGQYIEYVSVNASDVAPAGTTDCIYLGGMLEVKN
jgi:hypothetical protein